MADKKLLEQLAEKIIDAYEDPEGINEDNKVVLFLEKLTDIIKIHGAVTEGDIDKSLQEALKWEPS